MTALSRTKWIQIRTSFAANNSGTTNATRPPRTKIRYVKRPSSTASTVHLFYPKQLSSELIDVSLSYPDFCLWAPSVPNKTVGEAEGDMVAWCTKPGHGTRLVPDGLLTGLQFLKTPDYIQVVGFMSDQTLLDLALGDYGGEMDPHGADLVRLFLSSPRPNMFNPLL